MKAFLATLVVVLSYGATGHAQPALSPKNGAADVNPDTRLKLVFASAPPLGNSGKVSVFDASNDQLIDELDLSIPPGPRNTRTPAPYDTLKYGSVPDTVYTVNSPDTDTSHVYQKNYVGGATEADAHHFFPVLVDDNTATITPHNGRLKYGKSYYVQVDAAVFPFPDKSFAGITGKTSWAFQTKSSAPSADASQLVVAADGTGDFDTFQGAIDFVPSGDSAVREIFVRSGFYEEMVSLQNKQNLTLRGEDRLKTVVRYANNGVFNPKGRAEFVVSGSTSITLVNFTIESVGKDENPAQAEALYAKADKLQVHNVTMLGSGDALQIPLGARLYASRSSVRGYGDNLLSIGAAFFRECELISTYGPHGWPRNPSSNHGDVFVNSTFRLEGVGTSGDGHCDLARSPTSGVSFPYAEFVLIECKLDGIAPEGWGAAGPDYSNVHFWEYNSVNLSDGMPVDVSKRVSYSRQLSMSADADTIANYRNPSYVLAGWTPELAPTVLTQLPGSLNVAEGDKLSLSIDVAAEPAPTYQWSKDGQPVPGAISASLEVAAATSADAGEYTVVVSNSVGMVTSSKAVVTVGGTSAPPVSGDASMPSMTGDTATSTLRDAALAGSGPSSAGGASKGDGGAAGSTSQSGTSGDSTADGDAPASPSDHGGCQVDPRPALGKAWSLVLVALALALSQRRRRLPR